MYTHNNDVNDEIMGLIDYMVIMSDNDSEFKERLKELDTESRKRGVSFYEIVAAIYREYLVERKAKNWLEERLYKKPDSD